MTRGPVSEQEVAERVRCCWDTLRRVPAHGIPGYKSAWPDIVRDYFEAYSTEAPRIRLPPASPQAIDHMHEVFCWFVHLNGQRHLAQALWLMCGCGMGSRRAGAIMGCHRNTVNGWRREALGLILAGVANVRNVRECAA